MQHTKRGSARLWVTGTILVTAWLLGSAPYLYGWANSPARARFWAVPPVNSSDANQYLAFARMVSEGQWLLGDPFTSEPHAPRLFLPHALLDGLFCRLFGGDPLIAFHLSRLLGGALLLLAAAWLGQLVLPRWRQQVQFQVLVGFSAGVGVWIDRFAPGIPHGDFLQPEGNTLYLLGNLPHLALSAALLTALFCTLLAYERDGKRRWVALTVLFAHLLAWIHPFDFVVLGLSLTLYAALCWAFNRTFPRAQLIHAAALFVGALPAAVYLVWLTRTDPFYARLASDSLQVQSFQFYAIAHGLLALPALVVPFRRHLRWRCLLPLCWVVCAFGFLLTPFRMGGKQPRMLGGVHAPLALLAAAGLDSLARGAFPVRGRRRRRKSVDAALSLNKQGAASEFGAVASRQDEREGRNEAGCGGPALPPRHDRYGSPGGSVGTGYLVGVRFPRRQPAQIGGIRAAAPALLAGTYIAVAVSGGLGIFWRHAAAYSPRSPDYYQSPAVQHLFRELGRQGSVNQLTLGGSWTAGWAPVLADTRVYDGHWHMTVDRPRKRAERDWLFASPAPFTVKAQWLRDRGITWIIACPWEWQGWTPPLDRIPGVQPVYTSPEAVLYRFAPLPGR